MKRWEQSGVSPAITALLRQERPLDGARLAEATAADGGRLSTSKEARSEANTQKNVSILGLYRKTFQVPPALKGRGLHESVIHRDPTVGVN